MDSYQQIYDRAAEFHGGADALEALLPKPLAPDALKAISDDRWLAEMTKRVFRAGFSWQVIDAKWPNFEAAFEGFDPHKNAIKSDDDLSALLKDKGIVRNWEKIKSVRSNAMLILELAKDSGSAGAFFADWPDDDVIGLWEVLKKRGNRLGGTSGSYVLRGMGRDTFIFSPDVLKALAGQGIIDNANKAPTSKTALRAVQDAFNTWHAESGRSLSEISRTLACSVGP